MKANPCCSECAMQHPQSIIKFADWIVPASDNVLSMDSERMRLVCDRHREELGFEKDSYLIHSIDEYERLFK